MSEPRMTIGQRAEFTKEEISQLDRELAVWIGMLLRISIVISTAFILLGVVLWAFDNNGADTTDAMLGKNVESVHVSPRTIYHGAIHGSSTSYIQIGLLLLLLTPTVRVLMVGSMFYRNKLWLLVWCSVIVLIVLILGLFGIAQ